MRDMIDEMVNMSRPLMSDASSGWTPEADLYESAQEVVLVINVAGIDREDLDVSFHEPYVRVAGTRPIRVEPEGRTVRYHQLEMGRGDFERVFRIPAKIDENRIEATCSEGLLTVRFKKLQAPQPRRVPVHSGTKRG